MPGFKPKGGGGGKGKLSGGHWVTIQGHPAYIKGGKVVAGGIPGVTHGKDGSPHGPARHASSSIPMHPKPGGVKDSGKAVGKVQSPEPDRVQARADKHVRDTRKAADKAKVAHDRAKKELDRHNAGKGPQSPEAKAAGEKLKGLHERHAELGRELDRRKADLAEHDRKIAGLKEKLAGAKAKDATKGGKDGGKPAGKSAGKPGGETHTVESYAAKHGIGGANAHAHLDTLHRTGKVAHDPHAGTFHVPHGTPGPPGGKGKAGGKAKGETHTAESYAARHGIGSANAFHHLDKLHRAGKVAHDKADGSYFVPRGTDSPHTAKTSAPRNAQESAIHADAKARGKAAMIVTSAPQYRAEKSGAQTRHMVGGKVVATHEYKDGKHQVTVHHADGSRSVYRHRDARGAHAHLKTVAGSAIRSGTTRHAVVGSDLSAFDHRAHGIGGEHHRVTARVLGDGKSRVNVRSVHRGPVAGSGFRPRS